MYKGSSIVVVVPAYNEEHLIGRVIETMPSFVDRIVVVNDASTDNTREIVESLIGKHSNLVLVNHQTNEGVGGAIATGYKWTRDSGYDVAVVMAGDAQMDPSDLPMLLDPVVMGEADYSKGNRLIYANAVEDIPRVRFVGNAVLSLLTKIASGYWHVADSQTGYTAINKKALSVIDWDRMFKRYGQPNDVLVKLNVHSFRVQDVPIKPVYDVGEVSGIKIRKVVFSISWLLCKLFFWRLKEKYVIRDFHPLVFFYFLSFLTFALSFMFFVRLVCVWVDTGQFPQITGLAFMFCLLMSMQTAFFAMWFDSDHERRH